MCLAFCMCSGYIFLDEQEGQGSSLYLGWTLKDLEEFSEESCRKQSWQRFRDKIKMVAMGVQKAYLDSFCLWKPRELDIASDREGTIEVSDKNKK